MEIGIYFTILATVAVIAGFSTITRRHPLSATLSLVVALIALAGLYALLDAHFLFIVQILVYAGAIMALVIFVIMLLNVKEQDLPEEEHLERNVLLTLVFLAPLFFIVQRVFEISFNNRSFLPLQDESYGTIKTMGLVLYQNYFFTFEVVSILLLVALVGVVTLAKRKI